MSSSAKCTITAVYIRRYYIRGYIDYIYTVVYNKTIERRKEVDG